MRVQRILVTMFIVSGLLFISCSQQKQLGKPVLFGIMPAGQEIYKYQICNDKGISAEIINYGAIVVSLKTPDRNGKIEDVILGFDDLNGYIKDNSFQGAIVGRYGNRIGKGKFSLDGKEFQVTINDGENHLHGGKRGFFKAIWEAEQLCKKSVRLSYTSPDGEEGYPGTVKITVTYTITDDNALKIEYSGTTDRPTILNPTNHCYFNLTASPENTILNHELIINADYYTPVDNGLIPTGELRKVAGTPLDFTAAKTVGQDIDNSYEQMLIGKGYDHNWVLNNYTGSVQNVGSLYDPKSGRLMEILTDQPGLQFYSGNFLDGTMTGKNGIKYQHRTALCLEAQHFPDSPNKPDFPSVELKPGKEYKQTTIYKFSTR